MNIKFAILCLILGIGTYNNAARRCSGQSFINEYKCLSNLNNRTAEEEARYNALGNSFMF